MSVIEYLLKQMHVRGQRLRTCEDEKKAAMYAAATAEWLAAVSEHLGLQDDDIIDFIVESFFALEVERDAILPLIENAMAKGFEKPFPVEKIVERAQEDWRMALVRSKDGRVLATHGNVVSILRNDPAWEGVLVWDQFHKVIGFQNPPPFEFDPREILGHTSNSLNTGKLFGAEPDYLPTLNAFTTSTVGLMCEWLAINYGMDIGKVTAEFAMATAGVYNRVNPWRDWLDKVTSEWDGEKRVGYFGDAPGALIRAYINDLEEQPGAEEFLRVCLLGMVRRAYYPGEKVDHMLILEGPQGSRKTSSFGAYLPHESLLLTTRQKQVGDKDHMLALSGGKAFAVLDEVASLLSGIEAEHWKDFLSNPTFDFRPPYERSVISYPRMEAIVGTMNPRGPWLNDVTGGRRYMVIAISKERPINTEWIWRNKRQILGEVATYIKEGRQHFPPPSIEDMIKRTIAPRIIPSITGLKLADELRKRGLVFITSEDLFGILNVPIDRADQALVNRVHAGMTSLGWVYPYRPRRKTTDGKEERPTGWYDPTRAFEKEGVDPFASSKQRSGEHMNTMLSAAQSLGRKLRAV